MSHQGAIAVRGQAWACEAPVRTWHESGLHFPAVRQRGATTAIICHWTGAENPPEALHRNMIKGKLSVHFVVDAQGLIWQMMDAAQHGAHCQAHGANAYSVGIELINRGSAITLPDKGVVRPILRERIHGALVRYAGFTMAQVVACLALCESLCRAYELPMQVPQRGGDVLATAMTLAEARRWRGCAGHMHFEKKKADPGLELLRAIHARGAQLAGPGVA